LRDQGGEIGEVEARLARLAAQTDDGRDQRIAIQARPKLVLIMYKCVKKNSNAVRTL